MYDLNVSVPSGGFTDSFVDSLIGLRRSFASNSLWAACPSPRAVWAGFINTTELRILNASYGFALSQWCVEGASIFQGALLSRINKSSAIAAAMITPFNYGAMTIGAGAMRAAQNFFKSEDKSTYLKTAELGCRWRSALIYGVLVSFFGIMSAFLATPYLFLIPDFLKNWGAVSAVASVRLAFNYNLVAMISAPFRMMRSVDRQLFIAAGKNNLMLGLGLVQALVIAGVSYGLFKLKPSTQSIAAGGIIGSVVGCLASNFYLYSRSKSVRIKLECSDLLLDEDGRPNNSYGAVDGPVDISGIVKPVFDKSTSPAALEIRCWNLFSRELASWKDFKILLSQGTFNALSASAEIFSNLALMAMMARLGSTAFIANNIASQLIQPFILLSYSLGVGLQKIATPDQKACLIRASVVLALGVSALSAVVSTYGFGEKLINGFINIHDSANQELFELTKKLLFQYVFFSFGDYLRNIASGINQADQATKYIMAVTICCRGIIATGLSAYFGFYSPSYFPAFLKGAEGIVSGHLMGVGLGAVAQLARPVFLSCSPWVSSLIKEKRQRKRKTLWVTGQAARPGAVANGSEGGLSVPYVTDVR